MTITERIIEFMDQNGITQAALANALGVTKSTLNYTFINKKDFAAEDILPIAKFLKVSPMNTLLNRTNTIQKNGVLRLVI